MDKLIPWSFRCGAAVEPLKLVGQTEKHGTDVHFLADEEIFGLVEFSL